MNRLYTPFLTLLFSLCILLSGCTSLRIDRVDPVPLTKLSVTLLPVESSGIFGYQDWKTDLQGLITSVAIQSGLSVEAEAPMTLRLYLSDKTFVRGYQTLHSLYATLELRDHGALVRQVVYSEETQETLESSHKLYQVVRSCLEQLVSPPLPSPASGRS